MSNFRLCVPCPAKVNLFLAVGPPDECGYHPIRTLFQAIGLFDSLTIEPAAEDEIVCSWLELPPDNTLTKTLRLLRELCPLPPLRIELEKNIPAQTGLGGGSSDAAGILRAARLLLSPPPGDEFLHDIAAAVGKDVPFFLVGGRARGEGYGEVLTPLPDPDPVWFVVVRPTADVSTAEAYAKLDAIERPFLTFEEPGLHNDFERVAPCESLDYIEVLQSYGAEGALLCGSGSGVFGVFREEREASRAAHRLREDARASVFTAPALTRDESLRIDQIP